MNCFNWPISEHTLGIFQQVSVLVPLCNRMQESYKTGIIYIKKLKIDQRLI